MTAANAKKTDLKNQLKEPKNPGAAEKRASAPKTSGATVTIACKIPNGLELQLCKRDDYDEETPSGTRRRIRYVKVGEIVVVRGPANPVGNPNAKAVPLVGGYALTHGVSADFWKEWRDQNEANPLVVGHMIFAQPKRDSARDQAAEQGSLRSGLEPLIAPVKGGAKDPRLPKSVNPKVGPLRTEDERAKAAVEAAEFADEEEDADAA